MRGASRPSSTGRRRNRSPRDSPRPTARTRPPGRDTNRVAAVTRKALVTGGAGFIGSHLAELLLADGWDVYALDDLSTGNMDNVAQLQDDPRFHLVVDSVLSGTVVNELVNKCDVVYHLAAAVGVRLIVERPVHTIVTNLEGKEIGRAC